MLTEKDFVSDQLDLLFFKHPLPISVTPGDKRTLPSFFFPPSFFPTGWLKHGSPAFEVAACRMEILCMVNSPQRPQHIHYTSLKNAGDSFVKAAVFPHFTTNFSVFWTWALMSHVIYKLGPSWVRKLHQPYCVWSAIILLITSSFYCYSLQMFPGVTTLKVWEEVRKRKLRRLLSRSGGFEGSNQSFLNVWRY